MRTESVLTAAIAVAVALASIATTPTAWAGDGACATTAAARYGWGPPDRADEFDDPALPGWRVYDSKGHAGNGRRTPAAVSVAGGQLSITSDPWGNSGGMAWNPGQLYGRWEVCIQSAPAATAYHSVLLLWPDAEDWPVGGEIDFMEIWDPARQVIEYNLHYGPDNRWEHAEIPIDATAWHSWAVEWTPEHITAYVDGNPWWTSTDPMTFPPRPMHLCIQLDNFGGDTSSGGRQTVDWVRRYPLT